MTTDALADYIRENYVSEHHSSGTCKAGLADDPMAVVDSDLKVLGTHNLRVVDASVFPWCPTGNTNGATMSLGLMVSEKILHVPPKAPMTV
jgi:choline dehydrogenase